MSYLTYRLIHLLGIFTLITAVAAAGTLGLKPREEGDAPRYGAIMIAHACALLFIIVAGFGMLARAGLLREGLPNWVYIKLLIWVMLAAALSVSRRGPSYARLVLVVLPILALMAGATAFLKPL